MKYTDAEKAVQAVNHAKYRQSMKSKGLRARTYWATPSEHVRIKALSDQIKRERKAV